MLKDELNRCIEKYYAPESEKGSKDYIEKQKLREQLILEKDGTEIFELLKSVSENYAVVDFTDEEACCYEYFILLHKNQDILDDDIELMKVLNGLRYDLRIFVSILDKYYYMFIHETKYDESENRWNFDIKNMDKRYTDKDIDMMIERIDEAMKERGYTRLYGNDVTETVSGIAVMYKEMEDVIVFDLLFTDLVTIN